MIERITELELSKSYFFKVVYREGNAGFAATLELTPDLITFKVMTERSCSLSWNAIEAECDDLSNRFILKGLFCVRSRSSTISNIPSVGFFEIEFTVESVIFCPGQGPVDGEFDTLQIHSKTVNDWVGHTLTQEKILEANHRGDDVQPFLTEFIADANEEEEVGVQYNGTYNHSPLSYEQRFSFPPSLFYTLGYEENARNPFEIYIKIYNLISFLSGINPSVQRVSLEYHCCGYKKSASLYFVNNSRKSEQSDTYIMYPLGKDPRFEDWGLTPFPLASFLLYFAPGSELPDILGKYVKYRNMENAEDRLLGYFRLLEKHCYSKKSYLPEEVFVRFSRLSRGWVKANGLNGKDAKSFEAGLKYFNGKKYNTQKCVTDFLRSLPDKIQRGLGIDSNLITVICGLRNDITHANEYHVSENKIHAYTAYIHHLLIFAILQKLDVQLEGVSNLIVRLRNN